MTNYIQGNQTEQQPTSEILGDEHAFRVLSEICVELKKQADVVSLARSSFDEQRNKAAFFLNGEVLSNHETDTGDAPFPEMGGVFTTEMSKINNVKFGVTSLVSYYLGNLDTQVPEEE